jgi:hypothetical protein
MKRVGVVLILLFACIYVNAQGVVSGTVKEDAGPAASFATVYLLAAADSVQIKSDLTDEKGSFAVKNIPYGRYIVAISYTGFNKFYSAPFELTEASRNYNLGSVSLVKGEKMLGEVVVRSQKQAIKRVADRFIMNVAGGSFQTSNLLDIFRSTPFMTVQGSGIAINGKSNILVLVDNVPIAKDAMGSVFEAMSGNEIERIEFITNPSSQYDASADAVINIITKRGQLLGVTGSLRGNISQGKYATGNIGGSLTYRRQKLVLNSVLNYTRGDFVQQNIGYRVLSPNNNPLVLNEEPIELYKNSTIYAQLGLEYQLHRNHSISLVADMNNKKVLDNTRWDNYIAFSKTIGGTPDSVLRAVQDAHGKNNVYNLSFNYKAKLDSMGKRMDVILVYSYVEKLMVNQMRFQDVFDTHGNVQTNRSVIRNTNPSSSPIAVAQVDWQLPFRKKWKVDAGLKFNFSNNNSEPTQEIYRNNNWEVASQYSFNNRYRERIMAGYVNLHKNLNKASVSVGLRAENTSMQVKGLYERKFTDLFPYVMLQRSFSKNHQMTLTYRRTVNRPSFRQLTLFRYYTDDYTIISGNPSLKPLYSDIITLGSNIRGKLFLEAEFTNNKNAFSDLPRQDGYVTTWQVINLDSRTMAVSANYSFKIANWWQGGSFLRGSYFNAEGRLGNEGLSVDGFAWVLGLNNTFSLPGDLKLDAIFNYRSRRAYGLAVSRPNNNLRLALKGNMLQKRLQYVISVADIFRGDISGFDLDARNLQSRFYTYFDARRVAVGFVYNFGKKTVKEASGRKLGNEDVINRAN